MAADPAGEPPGAADPDVPGAAADEPGLLAAEDVLPDVQADRPATISNVAATATADVLVRETDMGSILPHRRHSSVRVLEPPASGQPQQNPSRWGFVGIR